MKTAVKRKNDTFLVITLKHVSGLTCHAKPPSTPKLWAITHENDHKTQNDKFLGITLKHVSGLKVALNSPRTIKLWAIAHENGHKTRKRRVSGHIFPTCIRSEGHCKSP